MKALNNPWVVGALAVTAAAVVGYQIFEPKWFRRAVVSAAAAPMPAAPTSNNLPAPAVKAAGVAEQTNAPQPVTNVDTDYFESHITNWAEAPQHDPFHLLTVKPIVKFAPPSPVPTWKLKAIWQQAGKPLVAINKGLYREGDVIEGYKIVKIEEAQVWFQGPDAVEILGFPKKAPRVATTPNPNSNHH